MVRTTDDRRRRFHQFCAQAPRPSRYRPRGFCRTIGWALPLAERTAPDRDRLQLAQRRQADARRPHSQHRPRRRPRADRGVPRPRRHPRQSYRRLGHAVRDGDLRLEKLADRASLARDPIAELVRHLQGQRTNAANDRSARCATRVAKSSSNCRRGDPENLAHLERMRRALDAGIRSAPTKCSTSITTSSAAKAFTTIGLPAVVERLLESGICRR